MPGQSPMQMAVLQCDFRMLLLSAQVGAVVPCRAVRGLGQIDARGSPLWCSDALLWRQGPRGVSNYSESLGSDAEVARGWEDGGRMLAGLEGRLGWLGDARSSSSVSDPGQGKRCKRCARCFQWQCLSLREFQRAPESCRRNGRRPGSCTTRRAEDAQCQLSGDWSIKVCGCPPRRPHCTRKRAQCALKKMTGALFSFGVRLAAMKTVRVSDHLKRYLQRFPCPSPCICAFERRRKRHRPSSFSPPTLD